MVVFFITEIDILIERLFVDNVSGQVTDERYDYYPSCVIYQNDHNRHAVAVQLRRRLFP